MGYLKHARGVRELDGLECVSLNEFVKDTLHSFVTDYENNTGNEISDYVLDLLIPFIDVARDNIYASRKIPYGVDYILMKIAVEDFELFEYIHNYEHTKRFMMNFDYRVGRDTDITEMANSIVHSVYLGTHVEFSYYFKTYIELVGGLTDEERLNVGDIVVEFTEGDEYFNYIGLLKELAIA